MPEPALGHRPAIAASDGAGPVLDAARAGVEDAFDAQREDLLGRLRRDAILHRSADVTVTGRDGRSAAWMLYTWPVLLSGPGLRLAAAELLTRLARFDTTQLAAYGQGALPLMSACVALGDGAYTGMAIRKETKPYGANRQIDPPGDRGRRVVIVDDTISSGTSFFRAAEILERNGYEVEGTACLVDFSYRGGRERACARGYRVETAFDMWRDIKGWGPGPAPAHLRLIPPAFSDRAAPDGLPPATVARQVARHYLETGEVLAPPAAFDRELDGRGGVWVSLRRRADDVRIARGGFWHFDPGDAFGSRDLVLATIAAITQIRPPLTIEQLERLKLAATFFTPLTATPPAELDFDRYGIVVRSDVFPAKLGGALPNTQLYTSTAEQYRHAREVNAKINVLEPHTVFRHELVKDVEPGERWPAYGTEVAQTDGWTESPDLGDALTTRALEVVEAALAGRPAPEPGLPGDLLGADLASAGPHRACVTLYRRGILARVIASGETVEEAVVRAARATIEDPRFAGREDGQGFAVAVSLLHDPEHLGARPASYPAWRFRAGRDTVTVQSGQSLATILDSDLCHNSWSKEQAIAELVAKAAITDATPCWTTYKTATWLRDGGRVTRLEFGAARREGGSLAAQDVRLMGEHLHRRLDRNRWPAYGVDCATGEYIRSGPGPRCIQALHALWEAGDFCGEELWCEAALAGFRYALSHSSITQTPVLRIPNHACGDMSDACFLHAAAAIRRGPLLDDPRTAAIAGRIRGWVRSDGCVLPPTALRSQADFDFLPGVALLALAKYDSRSGEGDGLAWAQIRRWYRRRFELLHPWGVVLWHGLVWPAVAELTGSEEDAAFAFEIADWACDQQLRADGSFLTDLHRSGPSFHSACVARGVASARQLALARDDPRRAERYGDAWQRAIASMDRLLIRPADTYWMPHPERAVGGIRTAPASYDLRVDQTGYTILSLLAGLNRSPALADRCAAQPRVNDDLGSGAPATQEAPSMPDDSQIPDESPDATPAAAGLQAGGDHTSEVVAAVARATTSDERHEAVVRLMETIG